MGKKIKTWSITDVVVMTLSAMKEHSLGSVTEEQRRYGQKDQDLVCNEFSGNDTNSDPRDSDSSAARRPAPHRLCNS